MTPDDHANTVREESALLADWAESEGAIVGSLIDDHRANLLAAVDALEAQANVAAEQMRVADREIRHALERNVELRAERGAAEARVAELETALNLALMHLEDRRAIAAVRAALSDREEAQT